MVETKLFSSKIQKNHKFISPNLIFFKHLIFLLLLNSVSLFLIGDSHQFGTYAGNILFNNALNTLLYGIRHMVRDHTDSETGNPLPPHGLLFPISSKGSFICIIPQTG